MGNTYEQVHDGETIELEEDQPLHIRCCDCGLVHEFEIKPIRKGAVRVTVYRLNRETGQVRRWMKHGEAADE